MGKTISIRSTIFPDRGFRISPGFWLLCALALVVGTPAVMTAVLSAAALHELGHLAVLLLLHVPVEGIRLGAFGAELYARTERLSYGQELLVTLAGPGVNLIAAPLIASLSSDTGWSWGMLFAGAHAVLGLFNLLPLRPLDGGQTLYLLTSWRWGPDVGDAVSFYAGLAAALGLIALGVYLSAVWGGQLFLLSALGLLPTVLQRSR